MKRIIFQLFTLLFFATILTSCNGSAAVNERDIQKSEIVTIRGCEVLITKSYQQMGEWSYGYMGMVKVDCDCIFVK